MTGPAVSLIVVSRHRAQALLRCLKGIEQLDYPAFEVIVVADLQGLAALDLGGHAPRVKAVGFDRPNISAARNLGLAQAAGEVVAFIDDDAVPEPSWLRYLMEPFAETDVVAAGGYVRGRNGISFQSTARTVDARGRHEPLPMDGETARVFKASPGRAIKTEGTNCAFRRDVLLGMGGFDPAFRFYLDETDLNLRLAEGARQTVIVPLAQVHHGFAASERRRSDRMPRSLYEIGASQVVFLRKHATPEIADAELHSVRAEQRARLLRHMVAGACEPRDVGRLMATLEQGFADGALRAITNLPPIAPTDSGFLPYAGTVAFRGSAVLAGRCWSARKLRAQAAARVASGQRVSLFLLSPTALYHRVRFDPAGYWEQRGGVFGKSDRSDPVFRRIGFKERIELETNRLNDLRMFTK